MKVLHFTAKIPNLQKYKLEFVAIVIWKGSGKTNGLDRCVYFSLGHIAYSTGKYVGSYIFLPFYTHQRQSLCRERKVDLTAVPISYINYFNIRVKWKTEGCEVSKCSEPQRVDSMVKSTCFHCRRPKPCSQPHVITIWGSIILFWPLWTLHTCGAHKYTTYMQCTSIHVSKCSHT